MRRSRPIRSRTVLARVLILRIVLHDIQFMRIGMNGLIRIASIKSIIGAFVMITDIITGVYMNVVRFVIIVLLNVTTRSIIL